jgi:hypothetical protein
MDYEIFDTLLKQIFESNCLELLENVARDYSLDEYDLKSKYMSYSCVDYDKNKCMARIKQLRQCSRNPYNGTEYCKVHLKHVERNNLYFGRMDEEYINLNVSRDDEAEIVEIEFDPECDNTIMLDEKVCYVVDDLEDYSNKVQDLSEYEVVW